MAKIPLFVRGELVAHSRVDPGDLLTLASAHWFLTPDGYAARSVGPGEGKGRVLLHRQLLGAKRGEHVDHINGGKLDNRRVNLRVVTRHENMQNRSRAVGSSGVRGVSWFAPRKCWRASICANSTIVFKKYYPDLAEAAVEIMLERIRRGLPYEAELAGIIRRGLPVSPGPI